MVESPARYDKWTAACLADGARLGQRLVRFVPRQRAAEIPPDPSVLVVDPAVAVLGGGRLDPKAMYSMLRAATDAAREDGHRSLRVVADMDWLATPAPAPAEVAAYELMLDEVVTELRATVVCAYRTGSFDADTIAETVAVHPSTLGPVAVEPGFRIYHVRDAVWAVDGEIDLFNADAWGRALATVTAGAASVRLRASGLRFVAAAGVGAVVEVTRVRPDLRIVVEAAPRSFTACWTLLGYDRLVPQVRFVGPGSDGGRQPDAPSVEGER